VEVLTRTGNLIFGIIGKQSSVQSLPHVFFKGSALGTGSWPNLLQQILEAFDGLGIISTSIAMRFHL
jgi:hypothetical protein